MKPRAGFALAAGILLAALALRLVGLGLRPMHHDEANQALKFGTLLEHGDYRYDPADHHGPSLYYLTLPMVRLAGIRTLAALDEAALRRVAALFGTGTVLLLLLFYSLSGFRTAAAAALLAALSPVMVYYSRFYIQETILVFFLVGFLAALWSYCCRPGSGRALLAGFLAGCMIATKETAVIPIAATVAAMLAVRPAESLPRPRFRPGHLLAALAAALTVAAIFYTSFGRYPEGLAGSLLSFRFYLTKAGGAGHAAPWYDYLRLLAWFRSGGGPFWSEALILGLAIVGAVVAIVPPAPSRGDSRFGRYVLIYTAIATAAYSVIPYKTPWNLLPFYAGFILLAGNGAAFLLAPEQKPWVRMLAWPLVAAGLIHLGVECYRANFVYHSDPRNPYVYAQTVADYQRLVARIEALARLHPDGRAIAIKVVAGPYETWPLPWSLRRFTRVGYWTRAQECGGLEGIPLVIASPLESLQLAPQLAGRFESEYYGLRPEVPLLLHVEKGLWERFIGQERK